jgi:hypothetical protein
MDRRKPDVIDADFEVIETPYIRNKWWQGWYIDWRVFAVICATSVAGFIATLMQQ